MLVEEQQKHLKGTQEILDYVRNQCEKHNMTTAGNPLDLNLMTFLAPTTYKEHKLLYKFCPKTGSTSCKRWFRRLGGDETPYEEMVGNHAPKWFSSWKKIMKEETDR